MNELEGQRAASVDVCWYGYWPAWLASLSFDNSYVLLVLPWDEELHAAGTGGCGPVAEPAVSSVVLVGLASSRSGPDCACEGTGRACYEKNYRSYGPGLVHMAGCSAGHVRWPCGCSGRVASCAWSEGRWDCVGSPVVEGAGVPSVDS